MTAIRDSATQRNLLGRTGRLVSAETTDDHRLIRLTVRWVPDDSGNFRRLIVRHEVQPELFQGLVHAACMVIVLRRL